MLSVGDSIPDVTLTNAAGEPVRLRELAAGRTLVVYFYPKDETTGCTIQACTFRDRQDDFRDAGATIVGISADPPSSHRAFADRHRLPFPLLSDESGDARRAFGIEPLFGLLAGRVTFVADGEGMIRDVYSSRLRFRAHVDRALAQVQSLADTPRRAKA
ncbi:MAG TPA: peroxiredoxin [Vulgatibacter sp.]